MYFLSHIRKDFCPGMSPDDFANAVQSMHGYEPFVITGAMISDLEDCTGDASLKPKYPESLLEEIALYCTRVASKEHSRLIELDDIVSFRARAVPDEHIKDVFAPVVEQEQEPEPELEPEAVLVQEPEQAIDDTSPALPALAVEEEQADEPATLVQ
jgi:hypothetical protein